MRLWNETEVKKYSKNFLFYYVSTEKRKLNTYQT